jgi:hypothetical protein
LRPQDRDQRGHGIDDGLVDCVLFGKPAVLLLELKELVLELPNQCRVVLAEVLCLGGRRRFSDPQLTPLVLVKDGGEDGHEPVRFARLDDEALGSQVEGELLVLRIGVGRRVEDEGDAPQRLVLLPCPAKRKSVHDGHQDVRDHEIRALPRG